jgi:hypothetical protein
VKIESYFPYVMVRFVMIIFIMNALAISFAAYGQKAVPTGQALISVKGTVTDDKNNLLSGVEVTFTNVDTKETISVKTDEFGHFQASMKLGRYQVRAFLQGFAQTSLEYTAKTGLSSELHLTITGPVPIGEAKGTPGGQKDPGKSAQDYEVNVIKLNFKTDAELQKWLNDQVQKKNILLGIIPIKNQESLFIIKPGKQESFLTQFVNSSLNIKDLKERIDLFPNKTFIGVHLLSENAFLIIFRETN